MSEAYSFVQNSVLKIMVVKMKTIEKSPEKIKKICSMLREEAIEPAQKEAQSIIKTAHSQAEAIVAEAHKSAEKLLLAAKTSIEQERNVFKSSLQQSAKQAVESLRQSVENKFFNENLYALIKKSGADPQLIANFINTIVKAIEKDGLSANLTVLIPSTVQPRQINELLLQDVLQSLQNQSVSIGAFAAGIQVKLNNQKVTIDITEEAIKELLSAHIVRKDFRKMIFES